MSEENSTGKWHGGKGSAVRKTSDQTKYANNYDRIFGKNGRVDPHDSDNPLERPYEPAPNDASAYDDARLSTLTDEKSWGKNDKS